MQARPEVSAVWLCFGSEAESPQTLGRYLDVLAALPYTCELTIVGNGAASLAQPELTRLLESRRVRATMVNLNGSYDESAAITAGLDASTGDFVVLLPPYLQSDPKEIGKMLREIESGADYVATWRHPRVDSRWGSGTSRLFNSMVRAISGVPLHDLNSGLRVLRRRVARTVPIYGDLHRFWPVLAARNGFRVVEVPVHHLEEKRGPAPFGLGAYVRRLLDLLTLFFLVKFTEKPLRFFGLLGAGALVAGTLTGIVLSIERYFGKALSDRPMLIFAVLLIVLGIQLFALGLLGELIIFTRGKRLRQYQLEKVYEGKRAPDDLCSANGHVTTRS